MSVVVQDTVAMLALTKVFQDRNKGMGSPHGGFHEKGDELAMEERTQGVATCTVSRQIFQALEAA